MIEEGLAPGNKEMVIDQIAEDRGVGGIDDGKSQKELSFLRLSVQVG